jgi:hypothetical protein
VSSLTDESTTAAANTSQLHSIRWHDGLTDKQYIIK